MSSTNTLDMPNDQSDPCLPENKSQSRRFLPTWTHLRGPLMAIGCLAVVSLALVIIATHKVNNTPTDLDTNHKRSLTSIKTTFSSTMTRYDG
jgi:hypothetical protein